jgi:hypothetical protein
MKCKIQMPVCLTYWDKDAEDDVFGMSLCISLRRVAYQWNRKLW